VTSESAGGGLPCCSGCDCQAAPAPAPPPLPRVEASLTAADRFGALRVRCGLGRDDYRVEPGLYALGTPDPRSPVLVSANYRLSFDTLRAALPGRDAWLLVLDTKGINVWCAAGKGTFGTDELVRRVQETGLAERVEHRRVIVPQLGAPGVAAHEVKRRSGFRVLYGPVDAADLPAFLDAGMTAEPRMRRKTFGLGARAVLIPVELRAALKWLTLLALPVLLVGGLTGPGGFVADLASHGLPTLLALAAGVLGGAVATPLLLPWLPGRAFSLKGVWPSLALTGLVVAAYAERLGAWSGRLDAAAWLLLAPALGSYLALNFTGASTFTSLSGVRREMRLAIPLSITAAAVGLGCWVAARLAA